MAKDISLSVALVTGAASGISQELAYLLAQDRYQLILVDKDPDGLQAFANHLQQVYGLAPTLIAQDLTTAGAAQRIYALVQEQGLEVDILINDAGFGLAGEFLETSLARHVAMVNTNVASLMELTYYFGRDMVERGRGRILQLASLAAFQPSPNFAVYSATKAFVLRFAEALAEELKGTGVMLTTLCPSAIDTNFFSASNAADTQEGQARKADLKRVAQDGYDALINGDVRAISGLSNELLVGMANSLPDPWLTTIIRSQFAKQD